VFFYVSSSVFRIYLLKLLAS